MVGRTGIGLAMIAMALVPICGAPSVAASPRTSVGATERFDIVIGSLCIGDVPRSARRTVRVIQSGADQYEDWVVDWTGRPGHPRPIIKFLREPARETTGASCRETPGDLLLGGDLEAIRMSARSSMPGNRGTPRITIPRGGLSLRVGHVHSGLAPIFGGVLDLAGSKAWIKSREALTIVEGLQPQGALQITSWARTVRGARLALQPGAEALPMDLSSRRQNITIVTPLDGSDTELLEGRLTGRLPRQTLPNLVLPSGRFGDAVLENGQVTIERHGAETAMAIEKVTMGFASARLESGLHAVTLDRGSARIAKIMAPISPTADVLVMRSPKVEGLEASAGCQTTLAERSVMVAAACELSLAAQPGAAVYTISSSALTSLGLDGIVTPVGGTSASFRVEQREDQEHLTGRLSDYATRLGALRFQPMQLLDMARTRLARGTAIRIPVDLQLPAAGGKVTHDAGGGRLVAEGKLEEFRLKGEFVLDLAGVEPWRLEIAPGDLRFSASGMVTYEPLVLGGSTQFASLAIGFVSQTPVVVKRAGATGRVLFAPALTTVLDPRLSLGRSPEGVVFKAPARLDARATLSLDLSSGKVDVETGRLSIETAEAIVEAGKPATVGDISVENGSLRFDSLSAVFDRGIGRAEIKGLQISAARLSSVPAEMGGTSAEQIAWSGTGTRLVRSGLVSGRFGRNPATGSGIRLEDVEVRDTCINLTDARVGRGTAFTLAGGSLDICVDVWSDTDLRGRLAFRSGYVAGQIETSSLSVAGRVDIPVLDLVVTHGTPRNPSGSGRLVTTNIDIRAATPVEIKQRCIGHPDFQSLKAAAHLEAAAANLVVQIESGVLRGTGGIAFARVQLKHTDDYDCRTELVDWKLWSAVTVKTDVPCPTWRNPFRWCRREIVVVPEGRVTIDSRLRIYGLRVEAVAVDPRMTVAPDDGRTRLRICSGQLVTAVPIILVSYAFQPRTPVPDFNRFVGDLAGAVVAPFQSMVVSSAANTLTTTVSLVRLLNIAPVCS
ncbi:hypothetical protein [Phreatobacter sp.]|uniref:hypothetical protein n=1 Tax=Phreatobacter sp. TaxID=1966341 RepID=UPI0022BED4C7|nr:hypothetical protein [Phreatobacter sp.]MCZ8315545.1 hypothetical protein [Phreatobacter sp.]